MNGTDVVRPVQVGENGYARLAAVFGGILERRVTYSRGDDKPCGVCGAELRAQESHIVFQV